MNNKILPKIIMYLVLFDFVFQTAWGLVAPFFSVFMLQKIEGANLATVGIAIGIYWIVKSCLQPLIGYLADFKEGEKDDFWILVFGMIIVSFVPLGYFFSSRVSHILLLEFFRGVAMACIIPIWSGFFTRHIAKGWESFSWGLDSTAIGLALGFSALTGGMVANFFGISFIFLFASILSFLTIFVLFILKKELKI